MSVLDRAIVKAFQRRRDFEAVQRSAAVERCAVVPEPAAPVATAMSRAAAESNADRILNDHEPDSRQTAAVTHERAVVIPEAAESPALPPLPDWISSPVPPPLPADESLFRDVNPPSIPTSLISPEPEFTPQKTAPATAPLPPSSRFEEELPSPIFHVQHEPGAKATYSASYTRTPELAVEPETVTPVDTAPRAGYTVKVPTPIAPSPAPPVVERPAPQRWKWPEICEQLDQFTGEGFRQLAKHLQYAADEGHKTLAFVSSTAGAGRTSVLLTLTRILALEGRSDVLLIDADRRHPQLVSLIPEKPTVGLREVLHGQLRLDQTVIPMDPGRVSMLPLNETMTDGEWQPLIAPLRALLKQARRDYDMILIDAGVLGSDTRLSDCWLRGAADAVITISRQLTGHRTQHDVLDWKQIGIESLGVIETFA